MFSNMTRIFVQEFEYRPIFQPMEDTTEYRLLSSKYSKIDKFQGREILSVDPEALKRISYEAFRDISFFLRPAHLKHVRSILDDPEASENDRFVATTLLQNAIVSSSMILPMCQDTGTAIIMGFKGERVWTDADDAAYLSHGVYQAYQDLNLRYSQVAPLSMFEEQNTHNNMPAQINLYAETGEAYRFLFIAKGGGSANKTFLYQQNKSLLNENSLFDFLNEKIKSIGTAACPPYHLAIVIGGTSAEETLKTVKLASAKYYDNLPTSGNTSGRAFRDVEWEARILHMARDSGIGAQFGGKYFALDARVIRLPRHAASCPVGIGVSCSADRNIKGKITRDGLYLEKLEDEPEKYLPAGAVQNMPKPIPIDLNQPMDTILNELSKHPVKTLFSLTGSIIVARDMAHAKLNEVLQHTGDLPAYFKDHPIYYAGPAKTPDLMIAGSFGPTTAQRMDPYVDSFMAIGASKIMIAKGNRSQTVTHACQKYGGFYLGSIGGAAAILAEQHIEAMEIIDFPELGMEAVRKIKVRNFPAVLICDDKGNNIYSGI
jgi:fumarate hydratase class I